MASIGTPRKTRSGRVSDLASTVASHCAVVDMFCGVGGLTHGFVKEGFRVVAGYDADKSCRFAYEANNGGAKFYHEKIEDTSADDIAAHYPEGTIKILVGCAPCRPYSSMPTKIKDGKKEWTLLEQFAELVVRIQPEVISMENVVRLRSFEKGNIFRGFVEKLEGAGYHVVWYDVYCPDYGIPQTRKRLVLFASRRGPVRLIEPTHTEENHPTLKDAIGHLPSITAGQVAPDDPLHRAAGMSEINLKRIRSSKPGGSWKEWDASLIADCHKRTTGKSYGSIYGRARWEEPGPTVTTQFYGFGRGRYGHPEQDRALSLREGAILQTFPQNYRFIEDPDIVHVTTIGKHIGNAVPVGLGQVIAKSIARHLEDKYG